MIEAGQAVSNMGCRKGEELVMADENTPSKAKSCFVIGPIGKEGSDVRRKADLLLGLVIKEVLGKEPFLYSVTRADSVGEPGLISVQVINRVIDADLVVADLSGQNPNAFYELAIRHMEEKPVIHMTDEPALPFDVSDYRAIQYDMGDIAVIESAKRELAEQTLAIESESYEAANPITKARGSRQLRRSGDPLERMVADLVDEVSRLKGNVGRLEAGALALSQTGGFLGLTPDVHISPPRRVTDVTLGDLVIHSPFELSPAEKAIADALPIPTAKAASSNEDEGNNG